MTIAAATTATPVRPLTDRHAHRTALSIGALLFVMSVVLQTVLMKRVVAGYDEGLILYGAARVAQGEVPYRDFWSMYGPGSFYVLAALFRAFGETVVVARGFDVASRAAIVVLVFALVAGLARREGGANVGFIAALGALGLLIIAPGYEFPVYPALAFALLAVAFVRRAVEAPTRWQAWFGAGAAAGMAAVFRHDLGAYALGVCCYALVVSRRVDGAVPGFGRVHGAALAGGFALALGPPLVALLRAVPGADLIDNLIRIPALVYAPYRHLPLPSLPVALQQAVEMQSATPLFALAYYAPIGITLVAAVLALRVRRQRRSEVPPRSLTARQIVFETLTLLTLLFCVKAGVRAGSMHVMPALILAVVPGALMVDRSGSRFLKALSLAAVLAVVGVRIGLSATELEAPPGGGVGSAFARWAGCERGPVARLRCFRIDADRAAVLAYLGRHAVPGVPIYIGTGRHDKLFVNNVELYFLSGLPAATKWHDLHPGVQTTREVQLEMLAEMRARPPQFVVVNTEWDDFVEPNASAVSSGVTLLDAHLRDAFEPVFGSGTFSVWQPRAAGRR